jgi:hypothetical protein
MIYFFHVSLNTGIFESIKKIKRIKKYNATDRENRTGDMARVRDPEPEPD